MALSTEPSRVGRLTMQSGDRECEYGIWEVDCYGLGIVGTYSIYEGYSKGDWRYGLPLAGPNAAHLQSPVPLSKFDPKRMVYFEGRGQPGPHRPAGHVVR